MFAEWIVGLLAALVAAPVAIASYISARRADTHERRPPDVIRRPHRAPAPAETQDAHRRRYHRHAAA